MKHIIKSLIIFIAAASVISCELDLAPENIMVDETTYKDSKTAEAALIGAYTRLNSGFSGAPTGVNNYANTGYMLLYSDIGTPTLTSRQNSGLINMETSAYNTSDHESFILSIWMTLYNAIDYANNIIINVNKYGDYGDSLMNQHIAEAKFIRAYEYLLLLQAFGDGALTGDMNGLGLILRLTPYDGYNPEDIQARATVGDTYQQIINDLQEALPFLPNVSATNLTSRTRASKTAAFALLSRVHLYKGSYSNNTADIQLAADYADSVLKNTQNYIFSTSYTHHTSWLFPLNPSGAETNSANYSDEVLLLAPHYTNANNYANGVGGSFFNKTYFSVDESFVSLYETGDRRGYFDPSTGTACLIWNGSDNYYPTEKTSYKYNNSGGYNNVLLIRLSEVKLTRAEALARLEGINDESITHLNDIYRKAFQSKPAAYTSASFANAQQLIDRILVERMKELAFEGHTRWDLIRTGRPLRNTSLTNDRKILPIPNYDVNISYGVIVQNKGYR